jgi:hypothetical protein
MSHKIRVWVEPADKYLTMTGISELSEHKLTRELVYFRWLRINKPKRINQSLLDMLISDRADSRFNNPVKYVDFEGEMKTYQELAEMFNTTKTTIGKIARKHNMVLKREDIKINRVQQDKVREYQQFLREKEEVEIDSTIGWAERKYFPETGKNGFSGGKGETNYPVRVVRQ